MKYVLLLLAILFGFVAGFSSGYYYLKYQETLKLVSEQKQQKPINLDAYKIYNLVNDYRASKGLNKLKWNPEMCKFSDFRLNQIGTDFSHNGFLPNLKSFYMYVYAGENLSQGIKPEKALINAWIKSPEHLKNIVDLNYTDTCISVNRLDNTVQEFASF